MGKGYTPEQALRADLDRSRNLKRNLLELLEGGRGDEACDLLSSSNLPVDALVFELIDIGEAASDPQLASRCRHVAAWLASEQDAAAWDRVAVLALQADLDDPLTSEGFRTLAAEKLQAIFA